MNVIPTHDNNNGLNTVPPAALRIGILSGYYPGFRLESALNHKAYADTHGYYYINNFTWEETYANRFFFKIQTILRYIDLFDWIFWIDDDAFFTDFSIPLTNLLELIDDEEMLICASPSTKKIFTKFSGGQFFLKSTRKGKDFLRAVLNIDFNRVKTFWREEHGGYYGGDQEAMVYLTEADARFNDGFIKIVDHYKFNNRDFEYKKNLNEHFLVHFTGADKQKAHAEFAERLGSNKWLIPLEITSLYDSIEVKLETNNAPKPLWRRQIDLPTDENGYCFNPTIIRTSSGLICIYRHVDTCGSRTLRCCYLGEDCRPQSNFFSWSDEAHALGCTASWYADPRAFCWNGRYYMTFNTGIPASEPINDIYLTEIGEGGQPLTAPKKLVKTDGRQDIEKNWGFFGIGAELYAIYSFSPFVILRITIEEEVAKAETVETHYWDSEWIERAYGPLHGGASPVFFDGIGYVVAQSRVKTKEGWLYSGTLLSFEARPPFRLLAVAPEPVFQLTSGEYNLRPKHMLNPDLNACLYPCGAELSDDGKTLKVTYGINDFRCGARAYNMAKLKEFLRPLVMCHSSIQTAPISKQEATMQTFFWQPDIILYDKQPKQEEIFFRIGNAGDSLQKLIITKLYGARAVNNMDKCRRLLGVGSIAHRMLAHDILWGCGYKEIAPKISPEEAATVRALAVRGPLTRDYLARHGVDVSLLNVYFDPGLLLTELFPEEIAFLRTISKPASGVLYLPHYRDVWRFKKVYERQGMRVGSMDLYLFDLCKLILEAELVVSSSLHGVIFAEALGCPAILHRPPGEEFFLKYKDYYLGTNRECFPIIEEGANPATITPAPLPAIPAKWRNTLPGREDLQIVGILSNKCD